MLGVTGGGPGLVAVGVDALGGDAAAAVWTSPDGITWSRVPHDEAIFGGLQGMFGVTGGGLGLVAVGVGDDNDAAVWTSPDGTTWSRVPHDEAIFGGDDFQVMLAVTGAGPGLVAVGQDWSGGNADAAVWTSPDGTTWSRVPHDEAIFGGAGDQEMLSVTVGGPGLVAVGNDGGQAAIGDDGSGGDRDAAVWVAATED